MSDRIDDIARRTFMTLAGAAVIGEAGPTASAGAAPMTDADRKNIEVVKAMSAAWKTGDADRIGSFFTADCALRLNANKLEVPARVGVQPFVEGLKKGLLTTAKIDMQVRDMFALDPVVVTCHYQLFDFKDKGAQEDLYIGVFFMQDGKIREWNDYAIIPFTAPVQNHPKDFGKFHHITS